MAATHSFQEVLVAKTLTTSQDFESVVIQLRFSKKKHSDTLLQPATCSAQKTPKLLHMCCEVRQ